VTRVTGSIRQAGCGCACEDEDALLPSEADLADYRAGTPEDAGVEALLASGVRRVVLERGAVSARFAIERNGLERLVRADRREAAERLSFLIQT
jgi:hypothetical protein